MAWAGLTSAGGDRGWDQGAAGARDAFSDPTRGAGAVGPDGAPRVLFSACKGESHTPTAGFKALFRRLRGRWRTEKLAGGRGSDGLTPEALAGAQVLVFGAPRELFTRAELQAVRGFLRRGGSLLVLGGEGGEKRLGTNLNQVLEEFGIRINADCVVRTVHHRYFHPKEALIADGILNRAVLNFGGVAAGEGRGGGSGGNPAGGGAGVGARGGLSGRGLASPGGGEAERDSHDGTGLEFVYPRGATLQVQKPAVAVLSSGKVAYPMHRPLGAMWDAGSSPGGGTAGRICVLGSALLFDDAWIEKEDNARLAEFVFEWLRPGSGVKLYELDAEEPDVNDHQHLPDTNSLAERVKSCLQDMGEELPADPTQLFDQSLFRFDTETIPAAAALYGRLNVKKAPLTLIPPQFEMPLPPLQPAVFPPALQEAKGPALDLFDLDDYFVDPRARLAQLTNKCIEGSPGDVEYFIAEAADILGLRRGDAPGGAPDPKALLSEAFRQLVQFKMPGPALGGGGSAYAEGLAEGMGEPPARAAGGLVSEAGGESMRFD